MICSKCGKQNNDYIKNCYICGCELKNKEEYIEIEKIPEELCFIENNSYGFFKINQDCFDIIYSSLGFGHKKHYIINYDDISYIELKIGVFPISYKDLYITVNKNEKYHFYIKKSNIEKWKKLVNYLLLRIIDNYETQIKNETLSQLIEEYRNKIELFSKSLVDIGALSEEQLKSILNESKKNRDKNTLVGNIEKRE